MRLEEGGLVRIDKVLTDDVSAEDKDKLPAPAVEVTAAPFEDTLPAWMGASSRAATLQAYLTKLSEVAGSGGAPLKVGARCFKNSFRFECIRGFRGAGVDVLSPGICAHVSMFSYFMLLTCSV